MRKPGSAQPLRRTVRLALGGLLATALAGCAMAPQLQRVAIDQNQMVADAEDELTLLNIVRASQRFPLHFTTISEVNGNARLSASAGVDLSLNNGPAGIGTGTGVSATTEPSYRAAVLSNETFQRGIQQPITPQTVAYYLDAGWPDQLIMALFVERVDIYSDDKAREPVASVVNEPHASSGFDGVLCNFALRAEPTVSSRPLADFSQLLDTALLASSETSEKARRDEITSFLNLLSEDGVALSGDTLFLTGSSNSVSVAELDEKRCVKPLPQGIGANSLIVPRFRSTQGIIYFLGEYIRVADRTAPYMLPFINDDCPNRIAQSRPLFEVESGSGDGLITTNFRGTRYVIPEPGRGNCEPNAQVPSRSMQVVAIVQQLLNLHKSADALPTSISVTGID